MNKVNYDKTNDLALAPAGQNSENKESEKAGCQQRLVRFRGFWRSFWHRVNEWQRNRPCWTGRYRR